MIKRLSVSLFAILFFWTSVTAPARAFAPPVTPLPLTLTAATPVGPVVLGAAAAVSVGMLISYLIAENATTGDKVRIPTNPMSQNQPPAPSVPSTVDPQGGYTLDGTEYWCRCYTDYGCGACYPNLASCADGYLSGGTRICALYKGGNPVLVDGKPVASAGAGNPLPAGYSELGVGSCPPGYSLSGGVCSLVDARAAQSDGNIDYLYNGQSISPASLNDADLSNTHIYVNSNESGTLVQIVGRDENGNPKHVVMVPLPDGGMKVQINTGYASGTSSGTITQTQFITDSTGTVTSVQTSTASGQVSYDPNTGGATLTSNPTLQNPDGTASSLPQAQPQLDIKFPNDYSREATQTVISNDVKSMKDRLDNTVSVDDPVIPDSQVFDDVFFRDTFASMLSWRMPAHTSACPVGSFEWNGVTYTVDAHCQIVNDHWGQLSQAMAVVWLILSLFIVMRA